MVDNKYDDPISGIPAQQSYAKISKFHNMFHFHILYNFLWNMWINKPHIFISYYKFIIILFHTTF